MGSPVQVLLVEDEDLVAMLAEDILSVLGYQVRTTAANLAEGLKCATEELYDLAILDVNLRGERSFAIADVLSRRGIPYIFVSGYGSGGIEPRFSKTLRLTKPYSASALQAALQQALVS